MIGKADWFRKNGCGCGVVPITWQGWLYSAAWLAVMVLPFLGFLFVARRVPESFIWVGIASAMWYFDVRSILKQMQAKDDENLFIIDENETGSELVTRNFDMQLRE